MTFQYFIPLLTMPSPYTIPNLDIVTKRYRVKWVSNEKYESSDWCSTPTQPHPLPQYPLNVGILTLTLGGTGIYNLYHTL